MLWKKLLGSLGVLLICMVALTPLVTAHEGVGAYNVKETSKYVSATALCSCGEGIYHYRTATFVNYCPNCHRYGVLRFEEGSSTWTSPEGMWYCSVCDMDIRKGESVFSFILCLLKICY